MKILITGGVGFVAGHLAAEMTSSGYDVWLSDCVDSDRQNYIKADLTDFHDVRELVSSVKPEALIHLGAISFVPDAAKDKNLLQRVNVDGTENLLSAVLSEAPQAKFLFVSTAQVLMEHPSPYAMSKLAGERLLLDYCTKGLNGMIARPANHTGPGQGTKFVVPAFIKQALEIKKGLRKNFTVGNLNSIRDFTDVRDVVKAYRLILEKGKSSEIYQIGSPVRMPMRELLFHIARLAGVPAYYEQDSFLWRPTDESPLLDTTNTQELGWNACIPFSQTISDIYSHAEPS